MGYARKSLISLQDTPYYHLIGRCARRAWLWGFDEYAGKDYSHRKQWVLDRIVALVSGLRGGSLLVRHHVQSLPSSGPYRSAPGRGLEHRGSHRTELIFNIPPVIRLYQSGEATRPERQAAEKTLRTWRLRLHDVSWYMRCLNEYLARRANAEDRCSGRFWEKSLQVAGAAG